MAAVSLYFHKLVRLHTLLDRAAPSSSASGVPAAQRHCCSCGLTVCMPFKATRCEQSRCSVRLTCVCMQTEVVRGSWRNEAARQVLKRWGMPVVPVWNDTVPLWDFHRCASAWPQPS